MDGSESRHIAPPPAASPGKSPWRRLALVGAAWVAVAGGSFALASALDRTPEPVCASNRPEGLPPFRLYLDRDTLPPEVARLPTAVEQVRALEDLATTTDEPARWIELGVVAQNVDDVDTAERSYRRALAVDPDSLEAKVAVAMLECGTNLDALARADRALSRLEADNPDSQLVVFNRGMVAAYRRDGAGFIRAFRRARDIAPKAPLGVTAADLLKLVESPSP